MSEDVNVTQHDLSQYLDEFNLSLLQDYSQIQRRVNEDPGTAGDQVEETWAGVLRRWLPSHYHVVTKGRVLSEEGGASPQIDVLVLWPSYPPFLLGKKLYMAPGIAAAFECKLTLRKRHLRKTFETAVFLTEMTRKEHAARKTPLRLRGENYAYQEFHRIFEYGLLAHSFEGDDAVLATDKFNNEIFSLDRELVKHPSQMVDLICVHDLGSWASERQTICAQPVVSEDTCIFTYTQHPYTGYSCLTNNSWSKKSAFQANFSPLGSFLARLYRKLSRVDQSLLPLSSFFTSTLSTGQGGDGGRFWHDLKTPDDLWNLTANLRARNRVYDDDFSFLGF